jgi:antitoxin MazE
MRMESAVRKWGNSAAVRIPASELEASGLNLDQRVDVRGKDGKLTIEPIRKRYDLAEYLARVTDENTHGEIDFGPPVGNEQI